MFENERKKGRKREGGKGRERGTKGDGRSWPMWWISPIITLHDSQGPAHLQTRVGPRLHVFSEPLG